MTAAPTLDVEYATTLLADRGVTVAGRHFAISQRLTFRQTAYVQKWRRAAKLEEMLKDFVPTSDAKLSAFVEDLIVESFENDAIFHLLAGGMVEVRKGQLVPWTTDGAERLAEFFAELSDPADQQAIHGAILGVLASFFLVRIVGAWASRNSSGDPMAPAMPEPAPTPVAHDPSPSPPSPAPRMADRETRRETRREMPRVDLSDRILASMPMPTPVPPPPSRDEARQTLAHSTS